MAAVQSRIERVQETQRRVFRIAFPGAALGMLVGYPVLLMAKFSGHLPAHLTWAKVVIGPILGYGLFLGMLWFFARRDLAPPGELTTPPNKALQLTRQPNGRFGVFPPQRLYFASSAPLEGGQLSLVVRHAGQLFPSA